MKRKSAFGRIVVLACGLVLCADRVEQPTAAQSPAAKRMVLKTETFDKDPGWEGVRNRIRRPPVRKQQNFGWSKTNHSGSAAGEIGGVIWRSVTPAYYGKKIGPFTFDDELSASGTIAVLKANTKKGWQTGSTVFVGFFNHAEQGWRPINYLGFRLETHTDTEAEKIESRPGVEVGYGTSKWTAGGAFLNTTGEVQDRNVKQLIQEQMRRVPPDGSKHTWELRYDPKGGGGYGEITIVFDGVPTSIGIGKHHREQGATFDRFGIFNNPLCGDFIEVYLDDITINGEKHDFATDPQWDGRGNHDLVEDTREYGAQDFGYSPDTNFAGGARPGELGGFFQSVDPWEKDLQGYYGDRVGPLNLDHKLVARGRFSSENEYSVDSTVALGWFNSQEQPWPMRNFVGVIFDSLTSVGRIAFPVYATSHGSADGDGQRLTFLPDGTDYEWTLEYDPDAAGGRGQITFTMNGQTARRTLSDGDRAKGATLDRFGVFNLRGANSKHCVVWFDDITYTSGVE
ncbi:hypothetical protein [Fontivita pretiosa]|uniref:hypothetical protein n=1 Tax=Fontivita pretiosa TaxID=2989684 RepID=UPI003D17EB00